jgi:hypothetical protein
MKSLREKVPSVRSALSGLVRLGALPAHGDPFRSSDHRERNLTRWRYRRLSVIQRFNVLCDRSQIRI